MTRPLPRFLPVTLFGHDLACERGGRLVFSGLSFSLGSGECLALRGPNGAGKSSLLRLVAGLIRPAAGSVAIEGPGAGTETSPIHYFGHQDALKVSPTLGETLSFWSRLFALNPQAADEDDLFDAAERVGLGHAFDLPVGALSAGQRRRAGLARLLVTPRPLWLMDEPTSSLDRDGEAILGTLMREHLEEGGSILAATHLELPIQPTALLDMMPQEVFVA